MTKFLLFVGSYADQDHPGIHAFSFDAERGLLEPRATYTGITRPSFLVVLPSHGLVYAVSETGGADGGSVWSFRFDAVSGTLKRINQQPSCGDAPCHLEVNATQSWLVVSNYGSGTACLLPIAKDGSLGKPAHVLRHQGRGTHAIRQTGPHVHSALFAPDQRFILVADLGLDQILTYGFDKSGRTVVGNGHSSTRRGAGPRHLAFHPHGRILYVANELDNTISVYEYEAAEGHLRERQSLLTIPPGAGENSVADVHVAPNGTRVYVSNRGHDSIGVFDAEANGMLTFRGTRSCHGQWPRHFAIDPTGRFIVIANQFSGDVTVLPVTESQTGLGEAMALAAVPFASCVQFAW